MRRDYRVYLDDILESTAKIREYTVGFSREQLSNDSKTLDAVIRNFMIIGEAAKNVPEEIRSKYSETAWRDMAGLRDIVVHRYFGVNLDIIWKVIQTDLPVLEKQVRRILSE